MTNLGLQSGDHLRLLSLGLLVGGQSAAEGAVLVLGPAAHPGPASLTRPVQQIHRSYTKHRGNAHRHIQVAYQRNT